MLRYAVRRRDAMTPVYPPRSSRCRQPRPRRPRGLLPLFPGDPSDPALRSPTPPLSPTDPQGSVIKWAAKAQSFSSLDRELQRYTSTIATSILPGT
ncbi:hypothetical protein JX266_007814 [Neoarthrinium moseri]|nr:hypothetical protein JX266_007814 [Neoarthrinium moseri]